MNGDDVKIVSRDSDIEWTADALEMVRGIEEHERLERLMLARRGPCEPHAVHFGTYTPRNDGDSLSHVGSTALFRMAV